MRLIDADAIKIPSTYVDLFENCRNCKLLDREQVREIIDSAPTIEPKRGRWKMEVAETIYGKAYLLTCSECGETVSVTETALPYEHFCRNCGASMREREGE